MVSLERMGEQESGESAYVMTSLTNPTVSHIFQDNKMKAYDMGGFCAT